MCDFKVGDEVVCVDDSRPIGEPQVMSVDGYSWRGTQPPGGICKGTAYTVKAVGPSLIVGMNVLCVWLVETANYTAHGVDIGYRASRFRKVQRRNSRLTLEAFFKVPGGFEEPKRAPANTPERV